MNKIVKKYPISIQRERNLRILIGFLLFNLRSASKYLRLKHQSSSLPKNNSKWLTIFLEGL